MSAPKLVESIPNANTPVKLSELQERRREAVGVITGGVLFALAVGLLVVAVVVLR